MVALTQPTTSPCLLLLLLLDFNRKGSFGSRQNDGNKIPLSAHRLAAGTVEPLPDHLLLPPGLLLVSTGAKLRPSFYVWSMADEI